MMRIYFVRAVIKMMKNTHRYPANRALHCIGAPFYVVGFAMALGILQACELILP